MLMVLHRTTMARECHTLRSTHRGRSCTTESLPVDLIACSKAVASATSGQVITGIRDAAVEDRPLVRDDVTAPRGNGEQPRFGERADARKKGIREDALSFAAC